LSISRSELNHGEKLKSAAERPECDAQREVLWMQVSEYPRRQEIVKSRERHFRKDVIRLLCAMPAEEPLQLDRAGLQRPTELQQQSFQNAAI